jgi:alpha-tubulin suppressor-like RCC1 family protein
MAAYTSGFTVLYNGVATDLTARYVSKEDLIDRYPSLASYTGGKIFPGLWGWAGSALDSLGTLGNGTAGIKYSSPVQIGALTNWKQVSSGLQALAIRTDGTLWAWGDGTAGQLGNAGIASYSSPIQIGALTDWNQVSAGRASFGIRTNGTMWSWGENSLGILGTNVPLGLRYSSPVQIGALTNWKKVQHVYGGSVIALTTGGTLFSWGNNTDGELGLGDTTRRTSPVQIGALTAWSDIAVSESSMYAIKIDGTLWAWGSNFFGQLGNSTTVNYSSPIQIGALTDWKQISAGRYHAAAIKTDGTLWTWGYNEDGQLGLNNRIRYSSPVQVGALTDWKQVDSGKYILDSSYCVKTDGTLWAWGANFSYGQLGLNNRIRYSSPVQVGSLNSWKSVSAGSEAVFAILDGYQ